MARPASRPLAGHQSYLLRPSTPAVITFNAYKDRDPESEYCATCFEPYTHSNGRKYLRPTFSPHLCNKNKWIMRTCFNVQDYTRPIEYFNLGELPTYNVIPFTGGNDIGYAQNCFINYRVYPKVVVCDMCEQDYICKDTCGDLISPNDIHYFKRRANTPPIATFVIPRSIWETHKNRVNTRNIGCPLTPTYTYNYEYNYNLSLETAEQPTTRIKTFTCDYYSCIGKLEPPTGEKL
jgi:hypothetical protein